MPLCFTERKGKKLRWRPAVCDFEVVGARIVTKRVVKAYTVMASNEPQVAVSSATGESENYCIVNVQLAT